MARLSRSRFTHEDARLPRLRRGGLKDGEDARVGWIYIGWIAGRNPAASCRVDDKLSYKLNTSGMKMHYPGASFAGGGRH